MKRIVLLIGTLAIAGCAESGEFPAQPDSMVADQATVLTAVHFVEKDKTALSGSAAVDVPSYVHGTMKTMYGTPVNSDFVVASEKVGVDGRDHIRARQTYNGIKVLNGDVVVHLKDGKYLGLNGSVVRNIKTNVDTPTVSADKAFEIAKEHYSLPSDGTDLQYERETSELVYVPVGDEYRLSWHAQFYTELQGGLQPGLWNAYVDAQTGEMLKFYNGIHSLEQASGEGGNEKVPRVWSNEIDVEPRGSGFVMETDDLVTIDLQNRTSGGVVVSGDSLDNFGDPAINDAHVFAEITLRMMREWYGYDSIDDKGFVIRSRVHYGVRFENALWNGREMTYGDGANRFYPLSGAVDVVAHEINHGFTSFHSDLYYSEESGGLNESFSDIAGTLAEFYAEGDDADFDMASDVFRSPTGALRYMCDPPRDGRSVGHYDDYISGMNVHYSSGISNKAFCRFTKRLASGDPEGSATADAARRAGHVWYLANESYFTSSTTFQQGCQGTVDAAIALGYSQEDVSALKTSWSDVGVLCDGQVPFRCDVILDSETGELTSPNYPQDYPNAYKQTWCIEPASGNATTVHFTDFATEEEADFVEVRANGQVVERTSGTNAPADVTATKIAITLTTDGSRGARGFALNWSNEVQNTPPTVRITSPQSGDTLSGVVSIRVDAQDVDENLAEVSLTLPDGVTVVLNEAPFEYNWDSRATANGPNYTILAVAKDELGATAEAEIAVAVDNSQPAGGLQIEAVFYDTPGVDAEEEAIWLSNEGNGPISTAGYSIADNRIQWPLPEFVIPVGGTIVLARTNEGFVRLFGEEPDSGELPLELGNSGDELSLVDPSGEVTDFVAWETAEWPLKATRDKLLRRVAPEIAPQSWVVEDRQ